MHVKFGEGMDQSAVLTDILLCFDTMVIQVRLASNIEAKFQLFTHSPVKFMEKTGEISGDFSLQPVQTSDTFDRGLLDGRICPI